MAEIAENIINVNNKWAAVVSAPQHRERPVD